jgi:ribonuclease Z
MFDVAEGVQRQLQFTTMNAGTVDAIFITHMHADHVLGLPGLLLGMSLVQKAKGHRRTVQIYGPPGLYDYIGMTFNLTMSGLESLDLDIYEMIGGDATTFFPGGSSPVRKYRSNIIRKTIPRQKDGTWVLQDIPNIPIIKAAEVAHLNGIQTFGFTVQEQEATRTINADKAIAMGLSPGRKYEHLKQGKPVWNDDGTIFINPDNVLEGRPRKARKFTIVGDNYALSPAMIRLAQDSDVLVHEATMTKEQMENGDAVIRGHSSAEMAGVVAKRVNAKCLVLNHISPKMKTKPDIIDLRNRAKEACGERCHLVVAHDFLELLVPLHGFVDVGHELDKEESV